MSDQSKLGIGHIIATEQHRDAIHVAVAPVIAGRALEPGDHVGLNVNGEAVKNGACIGIVDPFLENEVLKGQRFWLFLYPGSITSLRHEWTHPAFAEEQQQARAKSTSEQWMRAWALKHIDHGRNYADLDDEGKYQFAIGDMVELMCVGPNEDARDYINDEWWNHYEIITGKRGQRDDYFSCSC